MNDITRTSKDLTTCTHGAEHRMQDTLPCPWCVIDELKRNRDSVQRERDAYRSLAGIGFSGTDEADELAKIDPPWERDAEAYRRRQARGLALMKAVRAENEPAPEQPSATEIIRQMRGRAAASDAGGTVEVLLSDLRSVVAGMLTRASQPPSSEWRPIESAPKDGTEILLASIPQTFEGKHVPARVTVGHWTTDEEARVDVGDCGGPCHCREYEHVDPYWMSWDGGFTAENPATHWMPLPPPPYSTATKGEG